MKALCTKIIAQHTQTNSKVRQNCFTYVFKVDAGIFPADIPDSILELNFPYEMRWRVGKEYDLNMEHPN